jgi:2-oxo-3-hexenedioate decarboxylase
MNIQHSISKNLDTAATSATPTAQPSETQKISIEQAYKIQQELIQYRLDRGEEVTGYKLGFTSKAKMQQMGVHDLIWGVLTDKMFIKSGGEINLKQYIHPRAEPEIAFRISKDIKHQLTLEELPNYIGKMAVAIEVIDSRYKNFKFSLEDVIADNCSSIGYCIGEWKDLIDNIADLDIELKFNDEVVRKGKSKAILENPYQSVIELSRLATSSGLSLKKDQIILAGAATAAEWLKPKTKIVAGLEHFGKVSFDTL